MMNTLRLNKRKLLISLLLILIIVPTLNWINVFMPHSRKFWQANNIEYYSWFWISIMSIQILGCLGVTFLSKWNNLQFKDLGFPYNNRQSKIFTLITILFLASIVFLMEYLVSCKPELECYVADTFPRRFAYLLSIFMAGITEEFIFRAFSIRVLLKVNVHWIIAIILSALAFTLIHGIAVFSGFWIYFGFGILMGLVFYFSKNIIYPIMIHVLYNLFTLFYCFM